jgi:uncharacterized membrane protein YsdA (DUF1294 family)
MGSNIRLIGDDYCYSGVLQTEGFFGGQRVSYMEDVPYHGDRYTLTLVSFLISLLPGAVNGWIPALTIALYGWALYLFFTHLLKKIDWELPTLYRVMIALATAYFTLLLAPTVRQSLYFRSAMLPSLAPIIGTIFLVGWLLRVEKPKPYQIALVGVLAFVNGGLAENGAAFQGVALGLLLFSALWDVKRSGWKQWSALFLPLAGIAGTVLSVGVMALSPSISATLDAGRVPLGTALRLSLTHTFDAYEGFFRTQYLVVLVLLVFGFMVVVTGWQAAAHKTDKPQGAIGSTVLYLVLAQVVSLLLIFAIMLPSAYSRGVYPDPRHLIVVSMVMVANLIFVGFITGKLVLTLFALLPKGIRAVSLFGAALILLAVGLLYPVRYLPRTLQDRYLYQYWAQEWTSRDAVIRAAAARGEPEVHVMEMDHLIEDVGELGPDPDRNWYNQCAANAYGIVIYADQPGWDEGLTEYLSTRQ